jgi:hypothetical protein
MELVIWMIFGSLICSFIYWFIVGDYLFYDARWGECFFPGTVAWNKMSEDGVGIIIKIIISSILSVVLFMYTVTMVLFCAGFLICYGFTNLYRRIFKRR